MKYTELKIKTNKDGKDVYRVALPSTRRIYSTDLFITTGEGERFDNLAFRYYGQSSLWWVIASANGLVNGTLVIKPGTSIVIPSEI